MKKLKLSIFLLSAMIYANSMSEELPDLYQERFAYGSNFSCSWGKPACLDYNDKVCSSNAKCVRQDAVCFSSYTCDYQGFVCKSDYEDLQDVMSNLRYKFNNLVDEYDALVNKHNNLVDEYDVLVSKHNSLYNCVAYASSFEGVKNCI